MSPLTPYLALGTLLTLGATATASYFVGRDHGRDACEAKQAKAEQKAAAGVQTANADAAGKETIRQESHREIIREVPRIVEREVYRNVCLDADGVQLLDRAVAVANGEAGGREPDAAPRPLLPDSLQRAEP